MFHSLVAILFAPLFAAFWLYLGSRGRDLSSPGKFAAGLALMGLGFVVMYVAANYVMAGNKVSPLWLILAYVLHEWGALCLSPVGLSSMTKLTPQRFVGQAMGLWFLAATLGNNLAGQLSAEYDADNLQTLPGLFLKILLLGIGGAVMMLLLTPMLKRLMGGVK